MKEQGKKKKKGSSLKQQLRGVERLLKRDLTPEARAAHEKKLKEIQKSMENKKKQEIEKKYSKKYHMVKFFEKKKVTRAMNKVERRLKEEKDEDEVKRLKEEQEKLQEDMDYIVHFPNDMKYVSLFKTPDKEKVEKMRAVVRDRKEEAIRKSLEGSKSEDEAVDDEEEQDDFFMGVEDDENDDEEKEDDGENHQAEEQKEGKKKRDKRLPDRNRKKKKTKA